jgi:hypothetical protein
MRWVSLLCVGLIASVGLTGCGNKGGNAPKPQTVNIPSTPDGTVTAVAHAVADGKLEAVWQALPESYQGDINEQVEHFAEHMDGEVWSKAMSIVGKLAQVLETKQDLILGNAMVSQQLTAKNIKPADVKDGLTAIGGLLNDLSKDVKTKEALAKLNVENYLANIGSRYKSMEALAAKSPTAPQVKLADLKKVTATVKGSPTADSAEVEVSGPDGKKETIPMVRVQGKWVPKDMAEGWDKKIEELDKNLHGMELTAEQKKQFLSIADQVDGVLDNILKAKDQAAFDTAVGEAVGKVMPLIGAGGPPGGGF